MKKQISILTRHLWLLPDLHTRIVNTSTVFKRSFAYTFYRTYVENNGSVWGIRILRYSLDSLVVAQSVLLIFFSVTKRGAIYLAWTAALIPLTVGAKLCLTRLWRSQVRALDDLESCILAGIPVNVEAGKWLQSTPSSSCSPSSFSLSTSSPQHQPHDQQQPHPQFQHLHQHHFQSPHQSQSQHQLQQDSHVNLSCADTGVSETDLQRLPTLSSAEVRNGCTNSSLSSSSLWGSTCPRSGGRYPFLIPRASSESMLWRTWHGMLDLFSANGQDLPGYLMWFYSPDRKRQVREMLAAYYPGDKARNSAAHPSLLWTDWARHHGPLAWWRRYDDKRRHLASVQRQENDLEMGFRVRSISSSIHRTPSLPHMSLEQSSNFPDARSFCPSGGPRSHEYQSLGPHISEKPNSAAAAAAASAAFQPEQGGGASGGDGFPASISDRVSDDEQYDWHSRPHHQLWWEDQVDELAQYHNPLYAPSFPATRNLPDAETSHSRGLFASIRPPPGGWADPLEDDFSSQTRNGREGSHYLWLPRDPSTKAIDLNDTVELPMALTSSQGGQGRLGCWEHRRCSEHSEVPLLARGKEASGLNCKEPVEGRKTTGRDTLAPQHTGNREESGKQSYTNPSSPPDQAPGEDEGIPPFDKTKLIYSSSSSLSERGKIKQEGSRTSLGVVRSDSHASLPAFTYASSEGNDGTHAVHPVAVDSVEEGEPTVRATAAVTTKADPLGLFPLSEHAVHEKEVPKAGERKGRLTTANGTISLPPSSFCVYSPEITEKAQEIQVPLEPFDLRLHKGIPLSSLDHLNSNNSADLHLDLPVDPQQHSQPNAHKARAGTPVHAPTRARSRGSGSALGGDVSGVDSSSASCESGAETNSLYEALCALVEQEEGEESRQWSVNEAAQAAKRAKKRVARAARLPCWFGRRRDASGQEADGPWPVEEANGKPAQPQETYEMRGEQHRG